MSRNALPPKIDRRVRSTRERLGDALVALIQEKRFDEITVQEVLRRAGVGRSTFYAHYSDKQDLFLGEIDQGLGRMAMHVVDAREASDRVAPVREFFAHVGEMRHLRDAFEESDKMHDFLDLARAHFARGIERRLAERPRACALPATARVAVAHAQAGALLALLLWWLDEPRPPTPEQMDDLFHRTLWDGVGAA